MTARSGNDANSSVDQMRRYMTEPEPHPPRTEAYAKDGKRKNSICAEKIIGSLHGKAEILIGFQPAPDQRLAADGNGRDTHDLAAVSRFDPPPMRLEIECRCKAVRFEKRSAQFLPDGY